jgi:hypothetical protein
LVVGEVAPKKFDMFLRKASRNVVFDALNAGRCLRTLLNRVLGAPMSLAGPLCHDLESVLVEGAWLLSSPAVGASIVVEELHKGGQIFVPRRFGIGGGGSGDLRRFFLDQWFSCKRLRIV